MVVCKCIEFELFHYSDVIMSAMASQIVGISIVSSAVCSGADQIKHLSSASLALWREPVTGRFPSQRASNAENVPIWWHHHDNAVNIWHHIWGWVACTDCSSGSDYYHEHVYRLMGYGGNNLKGYGQNWLVPMRTAQENMGKCMVYVHYKSNNINKTKHNRFVR